MTEDQISESIHRAIERIFADISDRCGIGAELDSIDAKTKEDIREEWADILREELSK